MVKSLYSGVTGLKTHQQKMDVIGNNIANVNTTGYKSSVVTFSDVYYQTKKTPSGTTATLGGTNPRQIGYGVQMNTTTPNMSQSGFTFSDSIYDMAIDGEGFFQLMDGGGNLFYTRAGVFNVDESGYLVSAEGYHVLGVSGDSTNQPAGSEMIRITVPQTEAKCSSSTKVVNGVDVTISVSAPSDNTDMSVTFTNSEFPYATYANGILNIFFNMDQQYESDDAFEAAIQSAIAAGGITLPDDVELKFEFGSVPDDTSAKIATNSVTGWSATTTKASGEEVYRNATTQEVEAILGFQGNDDAMKGETVEVTYTAGSTADTTAQYTAGTGWTITMNQTTTAGDINKAIKKWIEEHPDEEIPELVCSKFISPAGDADKATAFDGMSIPLECGDSSVSFKIGATEAGEYANNYKVTFAYSASYGNTKAIWDENNLTLTVCNDTTMDQLQEAIITAAAGDPKKILYLTGLENVLGSEAYTAPDGTNITAVPTDADTVMNAAAREAFFGANPAVSLGGGKDSFYTEVAKFLTTFNLTDGRKGSEQSYKDLENITVQSDGTIIGYHSVHGDMVLGRIDIATFDNPNGLSQAGGTMFQETVASGVAKLAIAGGEGAGEVVAGALEMSNVDLSQEFTDMITTQRGYQANSRVITTSDTMLEELLNLKR